MAARLGKTEVTFAERDACVVAGACAKASDSNWGRGDQPVINVSWYDAKKYIAWLSALTEVGDHPDDYEPSFEEVFVKLADRLDPPTET